MKYCLDDDLDHYQAHGGLLEGRTILITGAGDGIGRELAKACSRLGAASILLSKTIRKLESVYDEIVAEDVAKEPAIYPLDLTGATVEDYQAMAATLESEFGVLDGLINNAGWLASYVPFQHYDMKLYHQVMMTNLHGPFMLTQALLPLLEKAPDPAVVFSTHAHSVPYAGAFGIAKAGLEAMMDILAQEYDSEDSPIRFNAVDTGVVDTAMRRLNYPAEDWSQNPAPADVIAPYLYFIGPESSGITGVNYKVGS
jgi:NAD(P)-dependent dehydrogenase (short-subunit alcohol dehydrogenase family)